MGAVDTNVRRWLVRRFDLQADGTARASELQRLADALASLGSPPPDEAASWTHASMELGAVVCRAGQPICDACPVAAGCPARDSARRVPVPRQSLFRGSRRAYRGALLRALASADDHSISHRDAPHALADAAPRGALGDTVDPRLIGRAIEDLAHDGLAHLDGDRLRLGPGAGREGHPPRRLQSAR